MDHVKEVGILGEIAGLCEKRRARTSALDSAVKDLLTRLEEAGIDDTVSILVGSYVLERKIVKSNVGSRRYWAWSDASGYGCTVYLDACVGEDSYLHGDFSCHISGPSRSDLIDFSAHVPEIMTKIREQVASINAWIDAGERTIATEMDTLSPPEITDGIAP